MQRQDEYLGSPPIAALTVNVAAGMMTWNPESRVALFVRGDRETDVGLSDARAIVGALHGWIGTERKPFALLGDAKMARRLDSAARTVFGQFFGAQRRHCYLALYNVGAVVRIAAEMFRIGIGVPLRAFADEAAARRWLEEKGFFA